MKNILKKNYFVFLVTALTLISFSVTFANEPPKKVELKDAIHVLQILADAGGNEKPDPEPEPDGVIGFETVGHNWDWIVFENTDPPPPLEVIVNPDRSGENKTPYVAKFVAKEGRGDWAGVQVRGLEEFALNETTKTFTIYVHKPLQSQIGIKLEQENLGNPGNYDALPPLFVTNSKTHEWEKITIDLSEYIGSPVTQRISGIVIFPDHASRTTIENVCLFDNISFSGEDAGPSNGALGLEIDRANKLISETEVGTEDGQVPQASYTTFENAIAAAETILEKADATQDEIDAAVETLSSAIVAFKDSILGLAGDKNSDGKVYIYATDDSLVDIQPGNMSDWGSGTAFDTEFGGDASYNRVIKMPVASGWGPCVAFTGFPPGFAATYSHFHFKLKGSDKINVKFPGATILEEKPYLDSSAAAVPGSDGWYEYSINILDNHGSLGTTTEFAILLPGAAQDMYITDIYFTAE
jgi:hypothetical protein